MNNETVIHPAAYYFAHRYFKNCTDPLIEAVAREVHDIIMAAHLQGMKDGAEIMLTSAAELKRECKVRSLEEIANSYPDSGE